MSIATFSTVNDGLQPLVYLDKPVNGTMASFEDGFSALEQSRKFFRESGLDVA